MVQRFIAIAPRQSPVQGRLWTTKSAENSTRTQEDTAAVPSLSGATTWVLVASGQCTESRLATMSSSMMAIALLGGYLQTLLQHLLRNALRFAAQRRVVDTLLTVTLIVQ